MPNSYREKTVERVLPTAIIVISALLVYARTVGFDFITTWDDNRYVYENPLIRSLTWANVKAIFSTSILGTYGPLHLLSYMLDHAIWGLNPAGYHLHNILLHALNGVLLYCFINRCGLRKGVALTAAVIFICHPVQVESVAWISQRKTLLAVTFMLLSLISYQRHGAEAGRTRRYYLISLGLFLAALLSKSLAVVLPLVLLAYDLIFRRDREIQKSLLRLLPYLASALICAAIALSTQSPEAGGGRAPYYGGGPLGTLFTMLPVFVSYLRLIVWPVNLSADYAVVIRSAPDATVILSGMMFLFLAAVAFRLFRRRDSRLFWVSFIVAGLLPVSQIVPLVTLMNDRYLYFPMIGVSVLFAEGGCRFCHHLSSLFPQLFGPGWGGRLPTLLLLVPLAVLPILSFQRAGDWRNGITLWGRDLQKYPQNHIIMTSLADSYRESGKPAIALRLYQQALAINPRYFIALNNYPNLLMETGNPQKAQGFAENLVRHYPLYAKGFEALGLSYEMTGNMEKSEKAFREALRLDPLLPESLTSLGIIEMRKGNRDVARSLLTKAEQLGKTPQLSYSMACFELTSGNREQAVARIRESVRLGFDNFEQLLADPCMKPLLDHPEIQALSRRTQ
jgi:tetratricopeptide (TPR) repeat protein